MRIGHKGFSLVEVIVSLAILAIVGGAVSSFLIAGNNSYIRGSSDLTLQEETQLTTNQMIDLIIDVQNDIKFEPAEGGGEKYGPEIDSAGNVVEGTSVPVRELTLYNDESVMMLRWQGGSGDNANQVFLLEAENKWVDGSDSTTEVAEGTEGAKLKYGNISVDSTEATRSLLAQYVTKFDVDLSKLSKRKVKLNLTFDVQGRACDVSETVRLRNELKKDRNAEAYSWITGIEISPSPVTVTQGESVVFTYKMTGDKGAVDAGVIWSWKRVDGKTADSNTYLDANGKLNVSLDEPVGGNGGEGAANAAIEVTVTSAADPSMSASAYVTVKELEIDSIYITPAQATLMQGESLEFECVINGTAEAVEKGVKEWTVEANGRPLSSSTTLTPVGDRKMKATLNVAMDQNTGINVIRITAQSAAVSSALGKAEAYVSVNKYTELSGKYEVKLIATNLTTYEIDSNGALGYVAKIECLTNYADYANGYPRITWEETTLGSKAYTLIDDPTEKDPYTGHMAPNYVTNLYCGTQINTHAFVQATVQLDAENSMVVGIDITIPNLEKAVDPDSPYIDSDNFVLYRQGSVDLELKGISDDISGDRITWEISNFDEYSDLVDISGYDVYGSKDGPVYVKVNSVGFGKAVNNGSVVYDSARCAYLLNPTGTGRTTTVDAEWTVDPSKEYRLNVVAKIDGKAVAETNVLVPRFDFLFPNGQRYMSVDAPSYHFRDSEQGCVEIVAYGFAENAQIGLSDKLTAFFSAEKEMSDKTFLSDTPCYRIEAEKFALSFQIGDNEQNDMIMVTIEDPVLGEGSKRNLVFYINHIGSY